MNVYEEALKKWGEELQILMAIEEMSELTKELVKSFRNKNHPSEVLEEMADVEIMLTQLKLIYGGGVDFKLIKDKKLARLAKMLEVKDGINRE